MVHGQRVRKPMHPGIWPDVQIKLWHPLIHLNPCRFKAEISIMQHLHTGISSIPQYPFSVCKLQMMVCISYTIWSMPYFPTNLTFSLLFQDMKSTAPNSASVPRIYMSVDVFLEALCVNVCECVARVWACTIWTWQWFVTDSMASGFGALLQRMTKKKNRHLIWMAIFSGPIMLQTISLHFTNHLFFFLSKFG